MWGGVGWGRVTRHSSCVHVCGQVCGGGGVGVDV